MMLGTTAAGVEAEERLARLREQMGLAQPLYVQYPRWAADVLSADLATSDRSATQLSPIILVRLPASVELVAVSIVIGLVSAIPAGVQSEIHHRTWVDYSIGLFTTSGVAVPSF